MARKGENIRKRKDGRWEGRIIVKCNNGEKKVYSLYDTSYQKVKEKVYNARNNTAGHTAVLNGGMRKGAKPAGMRDMSWDMPAKEWLEGIKKTKKHSTFIKYRNVYQSYIEMHFKTYPLDRDIEPFMIKEIFEKCGGRSNSIEKSVRSVLTSVFCYAAEEYKLDAPNLKKRTYKKENGGIQVLSEAEQMRLCNYLMEHMDDKLLGIFICITTGIRLGEVCSLKWSDIDFPAGIMRIRRTVQRISVEGRDTRTKLVETKPKTSCSEREIPLPDILSDLLRRYYREGKYIINGDAPMEPRSFQNIWKKCQRETGITYKNFHVLRHTFATNCVAQGTDVKSLSEILGHSDVKTTLNRYVHPTAATKREHINSVCVYFLNTGIPPAAYKSGHN